ncbi:MAG TPA: hypothetical protein VFK23_10730 [Nitrospirota bacterium]|nr:hypothetical protein [Nitrospirota bacterium]
MHQRTFRAVIILVAFILLCGMGGTGGFERAPRVEKNFTVTITDTSGNKISGEKFSWEGRIHFAGYVGMAQVTMPFDRIQDLAMGEIRERKVRVTAHLTDGSETSFDVEARSRCFGEATFGSFMLQMDEIKSIVFNKK